MNMWCPVFSKIVDSSLWCLPDHVVKVFMTILALKDSDHVCRYNAFGLAMRAHKTEAEVLESIHILSSPDTTRVEPQPFDGRRIEKHVDGWFVLNGQLYEDLMRRLNNKAYKAKWQRDHRAKTKLGGTPMGGENAAVKAYNRGDDAECDRLAAIPLKQLSTTITPGLNR